MHPQPDARPVVAIVGPTASGKTSLSLDLAERLGGEIVSVDSMQVYRHMDIGTAKPTAAERARVPHHLIDIVDPDEPYHAGRFVADAGRALAAIRSRGRVPILVGGTGLYLSRLQQGLFSLPPIAEEVRAGVLARCQREGAPALHRELAARDPASAARIHPNDRQRVCRALEILLATGIPWSEHLRRRQPAAGLLGARACIIGLHWPREELYARIDRRVEIMLAAGFQQEVERLLAMGYTASLRPMQAIGYRHMLRFLAGELDSGSLRLEMARDTRRYAKRQLTWFRKVEGLRWMDARRPGAVLDAACRAVLGRGGGAAGRNRV